jgi:alkylhydroperoxidase/carboxymuconolactone decarboxylase family protein YurZ
MAHPCRVMSPVTGRGELLVFPRGQAGSRIGYRPGGFVTSDTAVLDTLTDLTAVSIDHSSLPSREYMLVRLAALIAMDAPPASYLANADAAEKSGVTADDIQEVMIAIAPVVGAPRVVSAAGKILRAMGLAISVGEAESADYGDMP